MVIRTFSNGWEHSKSFNLTFSEIPVLAGLWIKHYSVFWNIQLTNKTQLYQIYFQFSHWLWTILSPIINPIDILLWTILSPIINHIDILLWTILSPIINHIDISLWTILSPIINPIDISLHMTPVLMAQQKCWNHM